MRSTTLPVLALVGTSLAATQLFQADTSINPRHLFSRQSSSCSSGYDVCGEGCILSTSSCCSQTDSTSCPMGYYCDNSGGTTGCCETGETCSGVVSGCTQYSKLCGGDCIPEADDCPYDDDDGSSTSSSYYATSSSYYSSSSSYYATTTSSGAYSTSTAIQCYDGDVVCNDGCMPVGSVCCLDGGYCDAGYYCTNQDTCRLSGASLSSDYSDYSTSSVSRVPSLTYPSSSATASDDIFASTTSSGAVASGSSSTVKPAVLTTATHTSTSSSATPAAQTGNGALGRQDDLYVGLALLIPGLLGVVGL